MMDHFIRAYPDEYQKFMPRMSVYEYPDYDFDVTENCCWKIT